ncbi:uncharacterized protein METZ01_LOCUS506132, partial [marine metagenome]
VTFVLRSSVGKLRRAMEDAGAAGDYPMTTIKHYKSNL